VDRGEKNKPPTPPAPFGKMEESKEKENEQRIETRPILAPGATKNEVRSVEGPMNEGEREVVWKQARAKKKKTSQEKRKKLHRLSQKARGGHGGGPVVSTKRPTCRGENNQKPRKETGRRRADPKEANEALICGALNLGRGKRGKKKKEGHEGKETELLPGGQGVVRTRLEKDGKNMLVPSPNTHQTSLW